MLVPRLTPEPGDLKPEFSAIYAAELDYVWRSVRRLGVPHRDIPDVAHDVFIVVFRNLWKFDATRELRPWLFGVLSRVVSDYWRLARNHRETFDPPEVHDPAPDPCERAERGETARLIDESLATVDLPHRAVLVMHDFEGYDGREISEALGIRYKTVYSRLRTARKRFVAAANERLAVRGRSSSSVLELLEEPLEAASNRRFGGVGAFLSVLAVAGLRGR